LGYNAFFAALQIGFVFQLGQVSTASGADVPRQGTKPLLDLQDSTVTNLLSLGASHSRLEVGGRACVCLLLHNKGKDPFPSFATASIHTVVACYYTPGPLAVAVAF